MAHQPQEKRLPVLKLFKSKLKKQPQLLPLPEFPAERCADQPERAELFLSMKYARKRRFNRKRRYRCVLEAGLLELHDPNNRDINSFSIEYRIDLAKVVVMYDEQRLVLKLQKEVLFLYPATVTMERFREIVRLHSLWSQQKAVEGGEKPPATTTTTQGHEADVVGTTATDETTAANPMHEYLRVLHATQLSVLDVSSRNLEQQVLLAEEMKRLYEHLKKTRAQTVKKQPKAPATKIPEVKKDVEKKKKAEEPAPPAVKKPDESKRDETEAEDDDDEEEGQSSRGKKN